MTHGDTHAWAGRQFDPTAVFGKPEALRGVRVIDLGTIFLGPTTTSYLAEYGAEVIKVEIPGAGDTIRALGPSFHQNMSLIGLNEPKNKYFVGLDVRKPRGAEIFRRLAARADVLVENFRAGTLDRWSIGYRQLREVNPRLIYSAHNGFGQWGEYGLRPPSYDAIAQGESGMAAISGFPERPPIKSGGYIGDYLGAIAGAATILAALHHRRRTGQGQLIEIAQVECLIRFLDTGFLPDPAAESDPSAVHTRQGSWHGWTLGGVWGAFGALAALHARADLGVGQLVDVSPAEALMRSTDISVGWWEMDGVRRSRMGNFDTAIFPYAYFRSRDGYILLAAVVEPAWQALCRLIGREALAKEFPSVPSRRPLEVQRRLHAEVEAWTMTRTFEEIWAAAEAANASLEAGVIVVGRVVGTPAEVVANPYYRERGTLAVFSDPTYGDLLLQMPFQKASASPPRLKWACRRPGQDNAHVYANYLGYGRETLADLRRRGIV